MEFQPIWISSTAHLDEFNEIHKRTGLWKRVSGSFTLPEGFPQLRTQQYTIPLIYFSSGSLDLQPDKGVFKPASGESGHNSQGVSYINLLENMCFDINYNSIISIELYRHQKYSIKVLNIQWIRILTKDSVLDGDILLCVGGSVSSGKADETTTRQLYEKLIDLTIDTVK